LAYFFVDESGYENLMTFVVISVEHPDVIQNTIKEWRNWARETIKNFQANEYKDHDASKRERKC